MQWLDYYSNVPLLCFDIEVINYEVSCISFSASKDVACVVPIGPTYNRPNGWTELEELEIWRGIQRVLGNPESEKIVQNGMFDIHFLLTRCGVEVRGRIHDTMVAHSVMYPELPKGLDFLGSIYCGAQEYWKDSVKFENIKGES
jgi:DNA polymerase-1